MLSACWVSRSPCRRSEQQRAVFYFCCGVMVSCLVCRFQILYSDLIASVLLSSSYCMHLSLTCNFCPAYTDGVYLTPTHRSAQWARAKIILGVLLVCCAGRLAGVIYFASHVRSKCHQSKARTPIRQELSASTVLRRPPGMTFGPCIPRDGSGMMTAFCVGGFL